ncbi:SMP-30/gluconolactonase/LRE family protein [Gemmata sp.]|uniref:SMP-30/gluconolactonase/LRE family protein n=1 Tax=Gemmata sp. TaxID=1914242 RepID=UPI003F72CBB3
MLKPRFVKALALFALVAAGVAAEDKKAAVPGIGPAGEIKKAHSGFKFTEGPAADAHGNAYFSDIPNERVHKIDADGKLSVFREKSNFANGLMVIAKGEVVACEMSGAIVALSADGKDRRVITDTFEGKRYNAPNDLVLDAAGGVYFTDPGFRAPNPLPQGKTCVYYAAADGKVARLIDDLPNPNGVRLSPDEKTLYVFPSGQKEMMSYPVEGPGKIGKGKVFCSLAQAKEGANGGGDGAAVDSKGNVYITSATGLQVFDKDGKALGTIAFPEQPSNAAFGGKDLKTLIVTARTSVYTCPVDVAGHRYPGK